MTNKVDGITLLQMIKEGKIKENTLIEVSGGFRTHYPYMRFVGISGRLYWESEDSAISQAVLTDDLLEYEFEITEEVKKPKKIKKWDYDIDRFTDSYDTALIALASQNEDLRNAVNYLLEKSDKE